MKRASNHIVKSLGFELSFAGTERDLGLQDDVAEYFHSVVLGKIEAVLDQFQDSNETVLIPKLVIDVGNIAADHWESNLAELIEQQLGNALKEAKPQVAPPQSIREKAFSVLRFYFKQGHLPWNSPFKTIAEIEALLLQKKSFSSQEAILLLTKDLLSTKQASERLCMALSTTFRKALFAAVSASFLPGARPFFRICYQKAAASTETEVWFWISLSQAFRLSPSPDQMSWIQSALLSLAPKGSIREAQLQIILSYFRSIPQPEAVLAGIGRQLLESPVLNASAATGFIFVFKSLKLRGKASESVEVIAKELTARASQKPPKQRSGTQETSKLQEETDTDIYIENAGLVLLHPFLSNFLFAIKAYEKGQQQLLAPERGVVALEYLAFGEHTHGEESFALNKILCGLDPGFPTFFLPDAEASWRSESEDLLQAVIGHWTALKNTSVAGLRETFLHRAGKLHRIEGGWKLQVERKAFDVLLSKLPWGIGMIKLPWMRERLMVEWD